jgi:uncharacterized protein (TIGR02466 family)
MAVQLWFPVPFMLDDAKQDVRDATHTKVHQYLASDAGRQAVVPAPMESVTTSYYEERRSILEDAALDELRALILAAGADFVKGMGMPAIPVKIDRAWINVFQPGAQEEMHSHDGSLISGTYYVDAPKGCGSITFPDPIGARRAHRAFTRTTGDAYLLAPAVSFDPEPGRLLMFESWVQHSIACNKTDQVRISIAFNLGRAD